METLRPDRNREKGRPLSIRFKEVDWLVPPYLTTAFLENLAHAEEVTDLFEGCPFLEQPGLRRNDGDYAAPFVGNVSWQPSCGYSSGTTSPSGLWVDKEGGE